MCMVTRNLLYCIFYMTQLEEQKAFISNLGKLEAKVKPFNKKSGITGTVRTHICYLGVGWVTHFMQAVTG
jgi:hypothetical protein